MSGDPHPYKLCACFQHTELETTHLLYITTQLLHYLYHFVRKLFNVSDCSATLDINHQLNKVL